jgi:hypothetical protein
MGWVVALFLLLTPALAEAQRIKPLTITCPPTQERSTTSATLAVYWPEATATGGRGRITFTYIPPNGSVFEIGNWVVDAEARSRNDGQVASCLFAVNVAAAQFPIQVDPTTTVSEYGQSAIACPPGATTIAAGASIQTAVNDNPAGTVFCLEAGTYREQSITPKNGNQFHGTNGAIISGARVLSSWTQDGSRWYATGQTQSNGSIGNGNCVAAYPMCGSAEDLWFDGVIKVREDALADTGAGEWFFDLAADRIYVGDNPTSATVETSVTQYAFSGSATDVVLSNLVVERYANHAQTAPIGADGAGQRWRLYRVESRYNHGIGVRIGHNFRMEKTDVHHNYQMGVGGIGDDALLETNRIRSNNLQFNIGWEAGGTKFVQTNRLVLRNNYVHDNIGPGLWLDINNDAYLIEGNTVDDNVSGGQDASSAGIFIEISGGGVIRNNIVRRNGGGWTAADNWLFGGGILVAASGRSGSTTVPGYGDVTGILITGNTVQSNSDGIALIQQDRTEFATPWGDSHWVENVAVTGNTVHISEGLNGAVRDSATNGIFSRNNTFENNTYTAPTTCSRFAWDDGERTFAAWQGYGHDTPSGSCTVQ